VIVVVSSPHRPEAFEAGRYAIDALKASVPIWKHEVWDGGSDWGTGAQVPTEATAVPTAVSAVPSSTHAPNARPSRTDDATTREHAS
jgi:molybdopterin synthase catalytic subunit